MKFRPLHDRVLIEVLDSEEKTSGGIIIPDTAKEKPQMGEVVATGPGKTSDSGTVVKMSVKKGDKVLYGKYSGTEITYKESDLLIMRESDILAIL